MTLVLVLLGAAVGAPARYLLDQAVQSRWDRVLPLGTMTVNVLGSFALGVLLGLGARGSVGPSTVALLGTGFCGGFTTYSTFGYETLRLAEDGATGTAVLNVGLSLGLGLAAAVAGSLVAGG